MAFSPTSTSSLFTLQSSCSALFFLHSNYTPIFLLPLHFLMLSTPRKDTLTVVTVTLESGNGAVVATPTTEKLESSSYGRQYFPLAAVVGQVYTIHFSLFNIDDKKSFVPFYLQIYLCL